ncbi:MAG: bacillithiol biosynthesis cysteine-adding enzyme BshC [bacterium]
MSATVPKPASRRQIQVRTGDARAFKVGDALFEAYTHDFARISEFYSYNPWSDDDLKRSAETAAARTTPTADVVEALDALNLEIGAGAPALEELAKIRRGAPVVLTGQQPGLFGGPVYNLYKMLTAKALAGRLEQLIGGPVATIFWCGSEDSDLLEVNHTYLPPRAGVSPDTDSDAVCIEYPILPEEHGLTMADLRLDESRLESPRDRFLKTLPQSPEADTARGWIREAYQGKNSLSIAFLNIYAALLQEVGIAFADAGLSRFRKLEKDLFRQELQRPGASSEEVRTAADRLKALGFKPLIYKKEKQVNLYLLRDWKRAPIAHTDGHFQVGDERFTSAELLSLLDSSPENFSTSVVLRPVTQDFLFRTAAYVGGPGEIAYGAQLKGVYRQFGIRQPAIFPRASFTVLFSRVAKILEKYGLAAQDLTGTVPGAVSRAVEHLAPEGITAQFDQTAKALEQQLRALEASLKQVDSALAPAAARLRSRLYKELMDLQTELKRALKARAPEVERQVRKARGAVLPLDEPQERIINPLYFYALLGDGFIQDALSNALVEPKMHKILEYQ